MRLKTLLLGTLAAALLAGPVGAAAPPSQGSYAVNLGLPPYGAPTFVPGYVPMWLNSQSTGVNTFGLPTPVGDQAPMPVTVVGGGGGGGGGTVTQGPQASAQSGNEWYFQDVVVRAGVGAPGDAARVGTGNTSGSQIAVAKQIANLLAAPLVVQGGAAVGSPPAVPPVPVSGVDGNGNKQHVLTDTTGRVQVVDSNSAAYMAWPVITPASGTYTPPAGTRVLSVNVTTAGNITMTDAAGNTKTYPLQVGFQTIPYLPASFTTTATGTFWGDK